MNDIKRISLTFENCEEISIDISDIVSVSFNEICRNLSFACGNTFSINTVESFDLILKKNAKILDDIETVFKLFKKDITIVTVEFSDGTENSFYVPWDESDDTFNRLQYNTFIDEQLNIIISR